MASWAAAWPQKMGETLSAKLGRALSAALSERNATLGARVATFHAVISGTQRSTLQNAAPAGPRRYMPGAPEIYFRKPIDNSRLVRAVDLKVKREMRLFAATVAVFFVMALVYLCQHCSSIEYGYKIEDLRAKRDQIAQVNRTLRLEAATLKDPERINALASNLGLALPAVGQVQRMDEGDVRDGGAPVLARADSMPLISVPN
jgi:cell division protein FtsL